MAAIVIAGGKSPIVLPASQPGAPGATGPSGLSADGYATRSAMAARSSPAVDDGVYLLEAGREGKFVVDLASNWTAAIAADTAHGVFVASTADATKVYRRLFSWVTGLDVRWFGAVLDDSTDDHAAILCARDVSYALALNPGSNPFYKVGPPVVVPGPAYIGANSYDMKHTHELRGVNVTGLAGNNYPSHLRNTTALDVVICQRFDTSGTGTIDGTTHFGADGSAIRKIALFGDYSGTEAEAHLIHTKCRIEIDDVYGSGARGDGLYIHADAVSSGSDHGNANLGVVRNSTFMSCRDGMSSAGGDSNLWHFEHVDTSSNRRWGRNLNDFLDAVEIAGHCADNGLVVGATPTVVSNGGNRYTPVNGQATTASTTAPTGTADTSVWLWVQAGGVASSLNIPAWTSGMTLREGGAALYVGSSSRKLIVAQYAESGQAPIQAGGNTLVLHPQADVRIIPSSNAAVLKAQLRVVTSAKIGCLNAAGFGPQFSDGSDGRYYTLNDSLGNDLAQVPLNGDFHLCAVGSTLPANIFYTLLGETTSNAVGKRKLNFPGGFGLGGLKILSGTAAPTTGTYVQGDYVKQAAPAVGQPKGWFCTVGGTPGTWVSEGNL